MLLYRTVATVGIYAKWSVRSPMRPLTTWRRPLADTRQKRGDCLTLDPPPTDRRSTVVMYPPCKDARPPQSGAHQYTACNVQPATVNQNPYPPVPIQHICPHLHTQACEDSRHAEGTARHTSRATRTTSQKTSENSPELIETGPSRHCEAPRPGSFAGPLLDATQRG